MIKILFALLLAAAPAGAAVNGSFAAALSPARLAEMAVPPAPRPELHRAARAVGPMTENAKTGYIVLSTPDYFQGVMTMHEAILTKLPKDVKAIVVFPAHNPYYQKFKADFDSGRFVAWQYGLESPWTRDFLPEVVVDESGSARMIQFAYYPDRPASERFGGELAKGFGLTLEKSKVGLEFGNFIADEQGRIFMTEKVLADNKGWTKAALEKEILSKLRGSKLVWMPIIPGENTGHIDIYAKYFGAGQVVVGDSSDPGMKRALDAAAARFSGLGMRVTRLKNADFPAGTFSGATAYSYTNSLRVNDTIFMPVYSSAQYAHTRPFKAFDDAAAAAYAALGFKVVKVPAFDAIQFGGAVHCLTREIPWLPWF